MSCFLGARIYHHCNSRRDEFEAWGRYWPMTFRTTELDRRRAKEAEQVTHRRTAVCPLQRYSYISIMNRISQDRLHRAMRCSSLFPIDLISCH